MYRGQLNDLQDTDQDGLPDTGYGACVNHFELDTTDNVFVDAEAPASGNGFFYLMTRVGGSQEDGLGTSSDGQPRIPAGRR